MMDQVLIFDKKGYIAGIQNVIQMNKTYNNEYYDFAGSQFYTLGEWFGEQVKMDLKGHVARKKTP